MIIPQNQLEAVESLYKRGLNLQAYKLAQTIAPLPKWEGTDARILAANLAYNLGAPETSFKWTQNTWRKDKQNLKAMLHHTLDILHYKGAIPALLFAQKQNPDFGDDVRLNVWWHCIYADIFGSLHDFETAEKWLNKAFQIDSNDYWAWVTKSHLLHQQDLYQESLETAYKSLQMAGWRRASVLATAQGFCLVERYNDALSLLTQASQNLESCWIIKELADLQSELGQSAAALENYEKLLDLMPMCEDAMEQWLYSRLSTMAYLARDVKKAILYADISSTPQNLKFKETLENLKGTEKRAKLPLGFVRQHEMTCAPATLSNISRYWKKKAEHLEIAEEICYDGTPAHSERSWAMKNGYSVREFTANWENVVELINRGVPITLSTIHPGNGHLQAIIGYDEIRRTFLIRDPYFQKINEFAVKELLEEQKPTGPRGMALVPNELKHLLEGLNLFESRQYDFLFYIEDALKQHNRPRAVELLEGMKREFPDHQLTWRAHWALAGYDANHLQILEAVEKLRAKYPDDINLKLSYLGVSQGYLRHDERLKMLEDFSKSKESHPLLWQTFAREISLDARQHQRALRWLYKTMRCSPTNPAVYRGIADIYWSKRKFDEALELYRIAACLNDKDEQNAWSYFLSARHLQQTETALKFLKDRFARFGHRSASPAQTLFHALRETGLAAEAFQVLAEALQKRPDDGELKIFAAVAKARFGSITEAKTLLAEAEKKSPRRDWLRTSAMIAELEGELKTALSNWQEIIKSEPLAMDAYQNIAFLLAATESRKSAQDYLKSAVQIYPYHRELHKYLLEWVRDEDAKEVLPIIEHLVAIDSRDPWSHREMARWLMREKRNSDALKYVDTAFELDSQEPVTLYTRGMILTELNRQPEAAEAYRQSLLLSIDFSHSIKNWLDISHSREEKLKVLEFVRGELSKQTIFGDGLLGYYDFAKSQIDAETLLKELKVLLEKRSDLWSAWSVVISQLVNLKRLDEAQEMAEKAVARFPLTHQLWIDSALVQQVKGETETEITALQKALGIFQNSGYAIQQLSEAYCKIDRKNEAQTLLQEAIRRMPLDHFLHGYLADVQWQLGEKEQAVETLKKALKLNAEYEWGWNTLKTWLKELKKFDEVERMAWQVASAKPNDVNSWLILAKILDDDSQFEKQSEAIKKALQIEPHNVKALSLKAANYSRRGLYDKALQVCQTRLSDGHEPELLRFYAARIEWERENYQKSVDMLEALTLSAPHFYASWERLAEIYREVESKVVDYLRVTKQMTKLAPQDPIVFGYYGEACLINDRRGEAKQAFKQAISLAPDYDFAACLNFDLNLEDKDREQTKSALEHLKKFIKTPATTLRELQYQTLEGNQIEVKRLWRELCLSPEANRKHIDKAGKFISDLQIFPPEQKFISRSIKEFLRLPEANEELGEAWVEMCWNAGGKKSAEATLAEIKVGTKAWRSANRAFINLLIENNKPSYVYHFIKDHSDVFKSDTQLWASCGYFLYSVKEYKTAFKWFADWEQRTDIQPWMLWNYSLTLRRLGMPEEAKIVHETAIKLELQEEDFSLGSHSIMLGLENANKGNFVEAKKLANRINSHHLSDFDKYFYSLLKTFLGIFDYAKSNPVKRDQLIKEMLNETLSYNDLWKNRIMRDCFGRSLKGVLKLNLTSWQKFKIQLRVWSSYLYYLANKK